MEVTEENGKPGLKLSMKKMKVMASDPIISWQIGEKMEAVTDFIFLGSTITADSDCSHEIKKQKQKMLVLQKKSYGKPRQRIQKQRHYFAYKGSL